MRGTLFDRTTLSDGEGTRSVDIDGGRGVLHSSPSTGHSRSGQERRSTDVGNAEVDP